MKLGAGLIATLAALVLGLMVSSAKGVFDSVNDGLEEGGASYVNLDRILAHYGPETKVTRDQLRQNLASEIKHIWPKSNVETGGMSTAEFSTAMEEVGDR